MLHGAIIIFWKYTREQSIIYISSKVCMMVVQLATRSSNTRRPQNFLVSTNAEEGRNEFPGQQGGGAVGTCWNGSVTYSAPVWQPVPRVLAMFPGWGAASENSFLSLVMETPEQRESLLRQLLLSQCRGNCCRQQALFISWSFTAPSVTAL